jgi:hypothetical protein
MKTPREVLLEHHKNKTTELDAIRKQTLSSELRPASQTVSQNDRQIGLLRLVWFELFRPAQRVWLGFATIWLGLLLFHAATVDSTPEGRTQAHARSERDLTLLREQRRLLVELTGTSDSAPFETQQFPKPHSAKQPATRMV